MANIKQVITDPISKAIDKLGVFDRKLRKLSSKKGSWIIVMYHRVVPDGTVDVYDLGMSVSRSNFIAQVDYFKENFSIIGVSEAIDLLQKGGTLPENALSVTFDDGYQDTYDNAFPYLFECDVPSALYLSTEGINQREPFWWDRVANIVANTSEYSIDLDGIDSTNSECVLKLSEGKKLKSLQKLLSLLWLQPPNTLNGSISKLEERLGDVSVDCLPRRLGLKEVRKLIDKKVEIGAHSISHINLTLFDDSELTVEFTMPKAELEKMLKININGFAFPGGRVNARVEKMISKCGFTYGLGVESGINREPYSYSNLLRIGMPNMSCSNVKRVFCKYI